MTRCCAGQTAGEVARICRTCRHFRPARVYGPLRLDSGVCARVPHVDFVTGEVSLAQARGERASEDDGRCGPQGRFYAPEGHVQVWLREHRLELEAILEVCAVTLGALALALVIALLTHALL